MNTDDRKELLEYIKNVPEWQSALIYEQLATLNKTAATLDKTAARVAQGFADSKLRPNKYSLTNKITRRDWYVSAFSQAASSLGTALAAIDMLSVLSDTFHQDFQHNAEYAYHRSYDFLEELCSRHGYQKEDV